MTDRTSRLAAVLLASLSMAPSGCSERSQTDSKTGHRIDDFRVIKFAGEKVVVPFRKGLPVAPMADPVARYVPKAGDRVALSDVGGGEVFLARDLDALKFYHSSPDLDQLGRFRALADEGRLFVVPRGTFGSIRQVLEGELPEALKAVELQLPGDKGGPAWVSDPFVRRSGPPTP